MSIPDFCDSPAHPVVLNLPQELILFRVGFVEVAGSAEHDLFCDRRLLLSA